MFERYTERARRVIFFARYEASQFGSVAIETEHLLLGLLREDKGLLSRFQLDRSIENIRREVEKRLTVRERVSTTIDLPLTNECERILSYAAEEAIRLNHRHIGTEHLLLGILREDKCLAAQILHEQGYQLHVIRKELVRAPMSHEQVSTSDLSVVFPVTRDAALPQASVVPDAETAKRIAESVWGPLYGAETIQNQMPLQIELEHGTIWTVTGMPPTREPKDALSVFILKADGRILAVGQGPAHLQDTGFAHRGQKPMTDALTG